MKKLLLACWFAVPIAYALAAPAPVAKATKAEVAQWTTTAAAYEPGQSREAMRRLEELLRNGTSGSRSQAEAALVELLAAHSTYAAKEFACQQLGIIGSKRALPALAGLLHQPDTCGIACLALTTYPHGKADETLRTALTFAQGTALVQIINTLGDRRDPQAVKVLKPLCNNSDVAVAKAAIVALGKIGDEAAWKALVEIAKRNDSALEPAITEATLRCAEARAADGNRKGALLLYQGLVTGSQPIFVRRAAFSALLRLDPLQAQTRILDVLHGSDNSLKPVAIAGVRGLTGPNASVTFATELPKLSPPEQVWLIDSLAARGDTAAAAAIGNALVSPEAAVRRAAIDALGGIGAAWTVPMLAHLLEKTNDAEEVRAVETALIDLPGGKQTDLAIAAALKKCSGKARATLITALARREGPAANLVLLYESRQTDPSSAIAALQALGKTATEREVSPLLERLTTTRDPSVRAAAESAAAQAISRVGSDARRSTLVRDALGWAQGPESRVALLGLLPTCGDAAALTALKAAVENPDSAIRNAAVRALADWPNAAAWDALARVYQQPASETLRATALRGLVRLANEENAQPGPTLAAHYRLLLAGAHSGPDLRLILGALGGAAQPDALQLALPLLTRPEVHAEAAVAVRRIAEAIKAQHPKIAEEALQQLQARQQ